MDNNKNVTIYNAEMMKYNNDLQTIILQNPLFFDEQYAYIVSVYSIWSFNENDIKLEKTFLLDRTSKEASIIRSILNNNSININDVKDYETVEKLVKKGVLIRKENGYYLKY